jgi:2-C-methyl-D-erythritol 2,4-cyclodiphosphate synthase
MKIRIGQGIDFHRLEKGLDLWLGGIRIPSEKGSVAHSDGDVLLHSICDAILGAAGLGDIGIHFPDSSDEFKNIDSKILLEKTCILVKQRGYRIVNIDSTIILEKPKISAFVPDMKTAISRITGNDADDISIKATTSEKMGFTGREEGIAATTVALLESIDN